MSIKKLGSVVVLAALAAGAFLWLRKGAAPREEATAAVAEDVARPRPPKLVVAADPVVEDAPVTPYLRPTAPAEPAPPAPPPPPPGPRNSTLGVLEDYRAELCACESLSCANGVGAKYSQRVAESRHRRADDAALERIKEEAIKCVTTLNANEARRGRGT
jgi:hypothetical protein